MGIEEAVIALADLLDELAGLVEFPQPRLRIAEIDEDMALELVAMPCVSPKYSPGGGLKKFGTAL